MQITYQLLLLLVLALVLIFILSRGRTSITSLTDRIRSRLRPAQTGSTLVGPAGETAPIPDASAQARPGWRARFQRGRAATGARIRTIRPWRRTASGTERLLTVLLLALLAFFLVTRLSAFMPSRLDRFVVLIAPFNERDGSISQTGRTVADQLVDVLNDNSISAQRVDQPPADFNAALALMQRQGADVLIYGTVAPGGMLDQASLMPVVVYRPSGSFAPLAWDGYNGRFVMPEFYDISDAPINGQVVLPTLLGALANYGAGRVDDSYNALGDVIANTPELIATLPYALRGNILWARGEPEQATGEYRRALSAAERQGDRQLPDPRPLLNNNLGAIQQDSGDPGAAASFRLAADQLAGRDLGALRYNLGLEYMREGRYDDAISSLEIARTLQAPSTPLLLALSEAYRLAGRFPQAREAISVAQQQTAIEAQATVSSLRGPLGDRLRGGVAAQRALLGLSELLGARDALLWELQARDQLDARAVADIQQDLATAVRETDALAQVWSRRSASEDAAQQHIGGLLALHQFRRASADLTQHRLWQAAVTVEAARVQGVEAPTGLGVLLRRLFGSRTALGQSRDDLKLLLDSPPNSADEAYYYGQALLLTEGTAPATTWFDQATVDYPTRPEPAYGQALVFLATNNQQPAIDALARAIRIDERYFPARIRLAALVEEQGLWPAAIEQRRWLAQQRPSIEQTQKLAAALRNAGPENYAEAERLLLSIVNDPQLDDTAKVPALTELGRLYYDNHDLASARAMLERAQRSAPIDPQVAYELGRVLVAQGDTDGAAAQFQRAIEHDPQPISAHLALAKFYTEQASISAAQAEAEPPPDLNEEQRRLEPIKRYITNINKAKTEYQAALEAGAGDRASLKLIAEQLLEHQDYATAATAYERLARLSPDDAAAHHGLGRAYAQLGRPDAAQSEERKALALRNDAYPEAVAGLGDIALRRGNSDEAVRQFNAALQQDPNLAEAYIGLGRVSAGAGNWAVAAAHFQRAVETDSRSAEAHTRLGEALLEQRDASGAIGEYRQAIGLKKDHAEAYYGLARAQIARGQAKDAQATLETALAIRADYDLAWLEQGKLYEQNRQDTEAISAYSKAIAANGRLAEARYRRALLYIRGDSMSEAESDLEAATSAQPNFAEAHYWLGRVYLAQDRPQAARDSFKTAVAQRGGNYPDAYFYQGIAEEQLGQRDEAVASFQSALAHGGDSVWATDAQAALARLGQP
jgi:tetratricopeptide (TPR) repeat protein